LAAIVHDVESVAHKKAIELNLKGTYFNSGVMLINIQEWNKQNISEKLLSMAGKSQEKYSLPDQDVLNILLESKTIFMPNSWNHMYGRKDNSAIP
jgi:lipopolysaccharide biosynthesis glycosyltransferase